MRPEITMRPAQSGPTDESNSLTTRKPLQRFGLQVTCSWLNFLSGWIAKHSAVEAKAWFAGQTSLLEATVGKDRPTTFLKIENQGAKALTDAARNGCAVEFEKLMIVIKNSGLENVLTGTVGPA